MTIIVELYQGRARTGNGTIRAQKWRWRATHPNGNKMATSAEAYTNRQDALDAIDTLFGPESAIQLRQPDQTDQPLRNPPTLDSVYDRPLDDTVTAYTQGEP